MPATPPNIAAAGAILAAGGLVCFPTDTVYGLAARADRDAARANLYAVKNRPAGQPSILMAADAGELEPWAVFDPRARDLAARFWPGPLTLVLPATPGAIAALGQVVLEGTLAVRVPGNDSARQLFRAAGVPAATSSANVAGGRPPTTGKQALEAIGDAVDIVIDGRCRLGKASSILDLSRPQPRVVREGSIPAARLLS